MRRAFGLIGEAGFDGVELVAGPEVWLRGAQGVSSLARTCGLGIHSVHQTLLRTSPRGPLDGRMRDAVRLALELGCPRVVIHGPEAFRWAEPAAQQWLHTLEACQRCLVGHATSLTLENPGHYSPLDGRKVLGQITLLTSFARRHGLDLTLDTCHAGQDLMNAYQQVRQCLANVHFSDLKHLPQGKSGHLARTLFVHHQMPGEGYLPLGRFLSALAADRFAGPLSVEVSPVALESWSIPRLRRRLAQIVDYVRATGSPT